MYAEILNEKQIVLSSATVEVKKKAAVKQSIFTEEENNAIVRVIELLVKAFRATPSQNFYGRMPLRKAVSERLKVDGERETHRVINAFIYGVKAHEAFRPTFGTPHVMITSGWSKAVAFADRQEKAGLIKLKDSSLIDEIIGGLSSGGAK